jgi:hypothetical protein
MRYLKIIIFSSIVSLLFLQCKKDKKADKDVITIQTLNGMVFNNCTDSGLAGVKVYFQTIKDNSVISSFETISGASGSFSFPNAEIHSSEKYTYAIYIQSKSGIGATSPEYTLFNGTTMYFTKDQAGAVLKPRVTPGFFRISTACTTTTINSNDTLKLYFAQNIFHKNVPQSPFSFLLGAIATQSSSIDGISNYPMGKYSIKIVKYKNNIYTTSYDSIYLGAADSKTYTINW